MQRYFVKPEHFKGNHVNIDGEDAHHIIRVMRFQPGESLIICDGVGNCFQAQIVHIHKEQVECRLVHPIKQSSELPVEVTIAQSLPKGDKMEFVVQKGTELGAHSFIPFISERSIVRLEGKKEDKRLGRWFKIAKEAAEQSHRFKIPYIYPVCNWKELLVRGKEYDSVFLAYERSNQISLYERFQKISVGSKVLIIIGPEGGFTESEVSQAEKEGCHTISLGPRILRTETAGLYVMSAISYHFEQMGNLKLR
ncbi:16S rRNA (uracil(1498)-N(3))-methyltransferase [Microaerobacter geothermalis]|uniref:16S rRNA (uracil(1498)-N(3))-methyltransferase n=1 Tax=Microaerobacter geothermalis TaxID=674972 RepID=UPI001F2A4666|nr:16S rRNA (uracil(1498)-N(3))-methyltransferase [Microaerobacter geothermalis]MCF6092861.1 16S rRNA (uracil(1498)-N(3))-methyltransferase [Microaerobacter geothermalis]